MDPCPAEVFNTDSRMQPPPRFAAVPRRRVLFDGGSGDDRSAWLIPDGITNEWPKPRV